jgi:Xaa-Pro aminopeptidase
MKLELLQNIIKEEKIDLLVLIHPDPTIEYLAEIEASFSVLKITENSATVLLSALDDLKPIESITSLSYNKNYKDKIKEQLINIANPKIAINKTTLTIKQFENLQQEFQNANFIDFSDHLSELRLTKTAEEVKLMFEAASIADNALNDFVVAFCESEGALFPTELSVALFLEKKIREQGATLSFPSIVATGKNSAVPHHVTGLAPLRKGLLLIDMGAKYKGYCSDMTRMFSIGEPTPAEREDFDLLLSVQESCIKKAGEIVESNEVLGSLDSHARNLLGEKEKAFIHSLGHGIGVEVHEAPRVSKECNQKILKNMPFTIEPGIYFKGRWGLRIEDTVMFDGEKIVRMTKSPKNLIVL